MKKIIGIFVALFAFAFVACADGDRPITMEQLPVAAQQTVKSTFSGWVVSYITEDRDMTDKSYTVMFDNGDKVEFDKKGQWKEIDCKVGMVPESVIPAQIKDYLAKHHPAQVVTGLDRGRRDWEVKLNNRLELKFDKSFRLIEVDN